MTEDTKPCVEMTPPQQWAPSDDAAIDRLLRRIDNHTLTRADWDAIQDEIALARTAAEAAFHKRAEVLSSEIFELRQELGQADAREAASREEVERLREALEYAVEHMEERLGHLLGGDDEKCIKHCRAALSPTATEGEG